MSASGKILDKDIREPLFEYLEEISGKCRIIEEKTMGRSRADVVMVVPDALYGIEIKSDADSYARLERQVADYDKYFDYNIVVVGTSHALHIDEHVPEHWGIITVEAVDGKLDFYLLRKAQPNPHVIWNRKLEILWRPELAFLQECYDMPKYKEKSKRFVIGKIVERIPHKIFEPDLKNRVSHILFERDYTTVQQVIQEYRKGEIQKKLEKEMDTAAQIDLYMQKEKARSNLKARSRKRRKEVEYE